jgi:ubiquinol-cytochrome c reductase cytochrome c subunit
MSGRGRLAVAVAMVAAAMGFFAAIRPQPDRAAAQTPVPQATPTATPTFAPVALPGRDLYLRDCAWCHGSEGAGGSRGPSLIGVGAASADFMLSTGRMPIADPKEQPGRAVVPYSREQIEELVSVVASFGAGPPIPGVNLSRGNLAEGATLYEDNCAACHGSPGAGGALTNGLIAPPLNQSTPVQVAEAIRLGGAGLRSGNMPKFGEDALTDQQVDAIAHYVDYLREPDDRGGQALGHFGPIPEGFVTWAVGLLALVLAIRWIGTSD